MKKIAIPVICLCAAILPAFRPAARNSAPRNPVKIDPDSIKTVVFDSINKINGVIAGDSVKFVPDSVTPDTTKTVKKPVRRITPVDIDDNKPRVVMHYYDKHGEPLDEPVMFLATLDTVTKVKSKPLYPLYNGVSIGVNFADAILHVAGQTHQSYDIWADVSLFNWFFPVVEMGVGFANSTPKEMNFTYKSKAAFYAKLGMNYNFLYKSDSAYQAFAGFRVGFSSFSYDLENVTIDNGYWEENQVMNLYGLKASAIYGDVLAGLKVKIVKNFSLGWNLRYHFKLHTNSKSASTPWFIPGYGASSPLGISFSAIYSFGQKPKRELTPEEIAASRKKK